jgi:rRNA maturation protein Nop10
MKPTMVLDSLNVFSDDHTSTTTTLTPTTLKHITQIFESDDCLKNLQQFEQSGFVPPLPPPPQQQQQQQQSATNKKRMSNNYCGGTTTVVTPIKFEPVATIIPKVEKFSSEESDLDEIDDDDEEYQPAAKKRMQTRNGGVRRNNNNNNNNVVNNKMKEVKRKRKGNMKDDYDGLPPTERHRLILRRERNKEAAARCRQRREDLTKSLMHEVKMWEGRKDELEDEIRQLRSQKEELEYILQTHGPSCGLMTTKSTPVVVAVKSEPGVIVEAVDAPYMISTPKRHRPASLTIPFSSGFYLEQSGPEGVLIETPSTVIPSFDNFMTSTGLTPVATSVTTPMFYSSSLNTPVSCAYQQRSSNAPDLNTPGETVSLVSL